MHTQACHATAGTEGCVKCGLQHLYNTADLCQTGIAMFLCGRRSQAYSKVSASGCSPAEVFVMCMRGASALLVEASPVVTGHEGMSRPSQQPVFPGNRAAEHAPPVISASATTAGPSLTARVHC